MAFSPIEQAITDNCFKKLRLIATDMDGTLTQRGKFTASLLQAFEDLIAANIPVLIVTGRSAGWVSGLVTYLPVVGAIAENGGRFYPADSAKAVAVTPIPDLVAQRQQL
ncbi:MAG: HAD hydrolase family protein, partial [Coleofasciculus sp. C3-bin4]|nr:HAD hydrolase family protein [Coleofasciculus sp. C3-bin4]